MIAGALLGGHFGVRRPLCPKTPARIDPRIRDRSGSGNDLVLFLEGLPLRYDSLRLDPQSKEPAATSKRQCPEVQGLDNPVPKISSLGVCRE